MLTTFRSLLGDAAGVTAIEYGLIAALIAIAAVGAISTIGPTLRSIFSTVNSSF